MEDRDGLVDILEAEGVIAKGPQVVNEIKEISTPFWTAPLNHALMPRDLFIVVGNEIIECSPQVRARRLESDLYKELFTDYFVRGAKWTVAPPSRLLDENFDYNYASQRGVDRQRKWDTLEGLRTREFEGGVSSRTEGRVPKERSRRVPVTSRQSRGLRGADRADQVLRQTSQSSYPAQVHSRREDPYRPSSPSEKHGWRVLGGMMGPVQ